MMREALSDLKIWMSDWENIMTCPRPLFTPLGIYLQYHILPFTLLHHSPPPSSTMKHTTHYPLPFQGDVGMLNHCWFDPLSGSHFLSSPLIQFVPIVKESQEAFLLSSLRWWTPPPPSFLPDFTILFVLASSFMLRIWTYLSISVPMMLHFTFQFSGSSHTSPWGLI